MSCCMCCTGGEGSLNCCCCFCVPQANVAVVTNCGKFEGLATPGLHCVDPCRVNVAGTVSLRAQQTNIVIESKTKENVFVKLHIQVTYQVLPGAIDVAFFYLSNPIVQIEAYVRSNIRAIIPSFNLDELYLERRSIAAKIKVSVDDRMDEFGYDVMDVLISNIEPDSGVRKIMDDVLASRRLQVAEADSVAAECIIRIKRAEANAELKRLNATGIANQRREVLKGFEYSIEKMREALPEFSTQQLLHILLTTQYMETMKEVAAQGAMATRGLGSHGLNPNSNSTTTSNMKSLAMQQLDASNDKAAELQQKLMMLLGRQPVDYRELMNVQNEMMTNSAQRNTFAQAVAEEEKKAKEFQFSNANTNNSVKVRAEADPADAQADALADTQDVLYMPHVSSLSQVTKQILAAAENAVPDEAKRSAVAAMLLAQRKGAMK